jgi:uncharacterized membrane protein YgaE (UPF0421/DUF939 family)
VSAPTKDIESALAGAAAWLTRGRPVDGARLGRALWPIAQTAVAASLAYYLAHSLVGHVQPFFAPIAVTVSMGTSTDRRAQRAVQLVAGVLLGIGIGVSVAALLGTGPVPVGVAVFVALCVALVVGRGFIAQGMLFFNQTAVAATLVLTVHTSTEGPDRVVDALIGGGIGLVFSLLLFPPDPAAVIRRASRSVFAACAQELRRLDELLASPQPGGQGWTLLAAERISQAMTGLDQARVTAREIVRLAPIRRSAKAVVARAERSAPDFVALSGAVLTMGSLAVAAIEDGEPLPAELRESIAALQVGLAAAAEGRSPGPGPAEATGVASMTHAAAIASVAAKSAGLIHRAAEAGQP